MKTVKITGCFIVKRDVLIKLYQGLGGESKDHYVIVDELLLFVSRYKRDVIRIIGYTHPFYKREPMPIFSR